MRVLMIPMMVLFVQQAFAQSAAPLSFDPPKFSLMEAVKRAQSCLKNKNIDVTKHFLKSSSFERAGNNPRVWTLRWETNVIAKGGWIDIAIAEDGTCVERYGE